MGVGLGATTGDRVQTLAAAVVDVVTGDNSFTVEMTVITGDVTTTTGNETVVTCSVSDSFASYWSIFLDGEGGIELFANATTQGAAASVWADAEAHQLAVVYDAATDGWTVYVDQVSEITGTQTNGTGLEELTLASFQTADAPPGSWDYDKCKVFDAIKSTGDLALEEPWRNNQTGDEIETWTHQSGTLLVASVTSPGNDWTADGTTPSFVTDSSLIDGDDPSVDHLLYGVRRKRQTSLFLQ